MNDPRSPAPTVEERLSRLERRVSRWRFAACGLAVFVAASAILGAAAPSSPISDVVRAKRFEVVGAKGEVQAYLGTLNGNSDFGILRLFDDQGKDRFTARTGKDETFVYVVNDKGQVGLTASADARKGAGITVSTTEQNGAPFGKVLWQAP